MNLHALLLSLAVAAAPAETMKVSWLGLTLEERAGGELVVVQAEPPAAPTVAAGDRLVAVLSGDHPGTLEGKTLCEVWPMLLGPMGESVGLRFVRGGKPFDATLTRTDPPGLEERLKATLPKGVSPEVARQMLEGQRNLVRAMALQPPAVPCGATPKIELVQTEQVTAFTRKVEKAKNRCDPRWLKSQPEVLSVEGSPAAGYRVFLQGGGPPVVIPCGGGD